ncbi:hypothetical protein QBC36DRAFT_189741, partial [Triangularia setosa]
KGGFGIFDEGESLSLLRRSLLWHRDDGSDDGMNVKTEKLIPITFPSDRAIFVVPSWSWMKYDGGIKYLDVGFDSVEWEMVESPWFRTRHHQQYERRSGSNGITLVAEAQDYDDHYGEGNMIFDCPGQSSPCMQHKCVVLGRQKVSNLNTRRKQLCYVLLVCEKGGSFRLLGQGHVTVYGRVGAGCLPVTCLNGRRVMITIQ